MAGRVNEHVRSLEAEVSVLKQLDHPNIVRYLVRACACVCRAVLRARTCAACVCMCVGAAAYEGGPGWGPALASSRPPEARRQPLSDHANSAPLTMRWRHRPRPSRVPALCPQQAPGEKEKEINDCKLIVQNIVYGMKTLLFSILYCTRVVGHSS